MDDAGGIIVNHGGGCPQRSGHIGLFKEGGAAPGTEDDLTGEVQPLVILHSPKPVDQDIGQYGAGLIGAGIQGRHGGVLITGAFVVDHGLLTYGEVLTNGAPVVDGSNGQGVGVRGRGANGVHAHAVVVQVSIGCSSVGPRAGVSGGHDDNGVGLLEAVQQGCVGLVGGHARRGRAQGQVDGIGAQ